MLPPPLPARLNIFNILRRDIWEMFVYLYDHSFIQIFHLVTSNSLSVFFSLTLPPSYHALLKDKLFFERKPNLLTYPTHLMIKIKSFLTWDCYQGSAWGEYRRCQVQHSLKKNVEVCFLHFHPLCPNKWVCNSATT